MENDVQTIFIYGLAILFIVFTFPLIQNVVLNADMSGWAFIGAPQVAGLLTVFPQIYLAIGIMIPIYFIFSGGD